MNYWERRQAEDAYEAFEDAEKTAKVIAKYYAGASTFLIRKAERVFEKFRQKHHLTEAEAKAILARVRDKKSASELLERLRASQNKQEKAELLSEIEAPAYRARLMRLAELQDNTDRVMEALYTKENDTSTEFYKKLAEESYLKEIYRTQQRANAAFSFGSVDKKTVDRVLRSKWSGKNYSERIWDNTQELADTLKDEMILSFLTGKGERDMARTIQERFRVGANAARRLVRTESNHIRTEMDFEAYKEAGVEEYQYLATLDLRTSKICRSLDGKIFMIFDRKVGVNCPPMHPWCRSTTISVIDRDLLDTMQRAAIDPATGERIMVPRTMTYQEWYEKYAKGKKISDDKTSTRNLDEQQFERYRKYSIGPKTYDEFRNVKYNNPEEYEKLKRDFRDIKQFSEYKEILGEDNPETLEDFQNIKYNKPDIWKLLRVDYRRRKRLLLHPEHALPGLDALSIDDRKFIAYLFDPNSKKGWAKGQAFISRLGYSIENYQGLKDAIITAAPLYPATYKRTTEYGDGYEQKIILQGLNGKPANVVIGWIYKPDGTTSMTTAYITEVKDDGD